MKARMARTIGCRAAGAVGARVRSMGRNVFSDDMCILLLASGPGACAGVTLTSALRSACLRNPALRRGAGDPSRRQAASRGCPA